MSKVSSVLSVVKILSMNVLNLGLNEWVLLFVEQRKMNTPGQESRQCWSHFCILLSPH